MKYLITLLAFFAFIGLISAQAPQGINFQGVARNADKSPKSAGTSVQIDFKIWDAPTLGNLLYYEKQPAITTNGVGLFTCIIGNGNVQPGTVSGSFSNIPWATGQKYLEVFVDNQSSARQLMVSVPYALYAEKSGNAGPTYTAGQGIDINGSNQIINIGDPNANDDITNTTVAGGDLSGSYPNPQVAKIQNTPVAVTVPTQGQVMMYDNGQWKPVTLPSSIPDIAIFEERKQNGIGGGEALGGAFNTRILNSTVKSSSNITLDINSGFMTFTNGTYIITASAPAVQCDQHRLCLRTNNDIVVLRGTSELSDNNDLIATRSYIQGVLKVPDNGTIFKLDHFLASADGGGSALGYPAFQVQGQETYAQIMIQKIQ